MMRGIAGIAITVLMSAGLGLAGVGTGTAQATAGPYKWCPGQPPPYHAIWDNSHCHTYWIVQPDQGNVDGPGSHNIWDGDNPPAPAPPPGMPAFLCRSEWPPQQCDAWGM
jgi:hypothetical protein